jgi:ribosome-binding factor A
MKKNRIVRVNSLLVEVITEVIQKHVRNPNLHPFLTVTRVETTKDLHYATVYISVLGDEEAQQASLLALRSAAGFIAFHSSKKVVMRYFPNLNFKLDTALHHEMKMQDILYKIEEERITREAST